MKHYAKQLLQVQVNPPSSRRTNLMAFSSTAWLPLLDSRCEYGFNVGDLRSDMTLFFNLPEMRSRNAEQRAVGSTQKRKEKPTVNELEVGLSPAACMHII